MSARLRAYRGALRLARGRHATSLWRTWLPRRHAAAAAEPVAPEPVVDPCMTLPFPVLGIYSKETL